jgi:hypothetical protein
MKKSLCTIGAFMLLGLFYAKAQLVTMYDLSFKNERVIGKGSYLEFENKDSKIFVNTFLGDKLIGRIPSLHLIVNGVETHLTNRRVNTGLKSIVFEVKIGNRNHLVCIDEINKKCVYGFFDDQPIPVDEFLQKALRKGF